MKSNLSQMENKVHHLLTENTYMRAKDIAKQCNVCVGSVSRIIRKICEKHIGVLTTKNGFCLSDGARHVDDVSFIRRLNGRRTSDAIRLQAALPDIKERWNRLEGGTRQLQLIVSSLKGDPARLNANFKLLELPKNS